MIKFEELNNGIVITGCDLDKLKEAEGILRIPEYIDNKKVLAIKKGAFLGCRELKEVIIEGDLELGNVCFMECTNLKSFIAPNVRKIEHTLFNNCSNLVKIDLSSLDEMRCLSTFGYCTALEYLELPNLRILDCWNNFVRTDNLTEISLPKLSVCGGLEIVIDDKNLTLVSKTEGASNHFPTVYKHLGSEKDIYAPALKKLVIPKQIINKDFDLSVLNFEIELI